jgi:hypothetical protein
MAYLDDIINEIHAIEDSIFKFNDETIKTIMERIQNIDFQGQVDHNVLYMVILHQVIKKCKGTIHTLTREEAEEFYLTGKIEKYCGWEPFAASFWFFNFDKNYIRGLLSYNANMNKLPKENYGILYNELKPHVVAKIPRQVVYETWIEKSEYEDTWNKLKEIIIFGKNNIINTGNFCKKVTYDTAVYYGPNVDKVNKDEDFLLDDEYKDTLRPELIKIPQKHTPQDIRNDLKVLYIIRGASFKQIDFEGDGYTKEFDNIPDLNSYLYSLIDYVNSGVEKDAEGNEYLNGQQITCLEKHYQSNKIPMGDSTKFYKLHITKFLNKIVVEAEVAEFGIYFKLTNFNGRTFCDIV